MGNKAEVVRIVLSTALACCGFAFPVCSTGSRPRARTGKAKASKSSRDGERGFSFLKLGRKVRGIPPWARSVGLALIPPKSVHVVLEKKLKSSSEALSALHTGIVGRVISPDLRVWPGQRGTRRSHLPARSQPGCARDLRPPLIPKPDFIAARLLGSGSPAQKLAAVGWGGEKKEKKKQAHKKAPGWRGAECRFCLPLAAPAPFARGIVGAASWGWGRPLRLLFAQGSGSNPAGFPLDLSPCDRPPVVHGFG